MHVAKRRFFLSCRSRRAQVRPPYPRRDRSLLEELILMLTAEVALDLPAHDEFLALLGNRIGTCPYSVRTAAPNA